MHIGEIVVDIERMKRELEAKAEVIRECAVNGHVVSENGAVTGRANETRVYDICSRCGLSYKGKPTAKEQTRYRELMDMEFR